MAVATFGDLLANPPLLAFAQTLVRVPGLVGVHAFEDLEDGIHVEVVAGAGHAKQCRQKLGVILYFV